MSFDPIQIDPSVTKRESSWIQVCPNCQQERFVSYAQAYNIKKGICKKECKPCSIELGSYVINKSGLSKGRKFNGGTTGKKLTGKSIHLEYQHLFNSLNKTDKVRDSFRKAKLGKRGKETNNWKNGSKSERLKEMSRDAYKRWRRYVFERDQYTCQECGQIGGNLHAHHIVFWSKRKDLRYIVSNGLTLCKDCHIELHNKVGRH